MNTAIQRQTDRRKVYRYIYDHPQPVTAWELGEELSLEAPVVSSSLAGLLEEGMVTRLEDEAYVLDPLARVAAGLCMLDDRVQLLAIDLRGEELGSRELSMPFSPICFKDPPTSKSWLIRAPPVYSSPARSSSDIPQVSASLSVKPSSSKARAGGPRSNAVSRQSSRPRATTNRR